MSKWRGFNRKGNTMKKNAPKSFEEALSRLESLTQSMQGEMPLEDALAAYQEGNELVRYCQTKLAQVEQKLQVLDADGPKELNLESDE
ncbi:TPA: exodeoxyribonuclease VII small subunit [Neisseria meningitidis]|uniref:Exodeoxyribonuclease 7 small subunit n=1 Tax=Neisseria lactamica ATCC 23970 TaxID=546265 RepID=D0W877_NEILA|nr:MULTISPECIES: exodeoxyribonuclease VII small subunit [Neisseria]EEZ76205.1 exodeoxyribonuclease VII, small subunit [Neisseria lactamica ATCC 23970]